MPTIAVPAGAMTLTGRLAYPLAAPSPVVPVDALRREIRRVRRAAIRSPDGLWLFYQRFQLDLESGVGLDSGQGRDPQVMLRWSDDAGHTWGDEHWVSAGPVGQYGRRAIWRRLGRSRHRVCEVVISDPVRVAWVGAWIDVAPGVH